MYLLLFSKDPNDDIKNLIPADVFIDFVVYTDIKSGYKNYKS